MLMVMFEGYNTVGGIPSGIPLIPNEASFSGARAVLQECFFTVNMMMALF